MLLSPAKKLDFSSPLATRKHSQPRLLDYSAELIEVLRTKSISELASLMKISDELAALNSERYLDFETPFTSSNARPAVLGFAGDVYQGMAPATRFAERDFTEAQKTVRILSGLYGLLRPLDLMQPYRLEMGTALATSRGRNLYEFWADQISTLINSDLTAAPGPAVVINLASQEYFSAVNPDVVSAPIISPRFEEVGATGKRRMVSFFAKRARGEFAAWLVLNRVRTLRALQEFDADGYHYDPQHSTAQVPVFVRQQAA